MFLNQSIHQIIDNLHFKRFQTGFILLMCSLSYISSIAQNVSISHNGALPDSSAMLDVSSTNRGFLMPRMTKSQRESISDPANGLMVLQTNGSLGLYLYDSTITDWQHILDSAALYSYISLLDSDSTRIADSDGNTKIQTEETFNENVIRFDLGGTEYYTFKSGRINILNTGASVFLGNEAGLNDDLSNNGHVFIGNEAGKSNATGLRNTAIGNQAMLNASNNNNSIAIGHNAGLNMLGNTNVAIGNFSMGNSSNASGSVMLGWVAGEFSTGSSNVGIGSSVLQNNASGSENVAIGALAGSSSTGSRNIYLGWQAGSNASGSDKLYIENSNSSSPLIYGDFANDSIQINGKLHTTNGLIVSAGDIGFGTTSPTYKLEVVGSIGSDSLLTTSIFSKGFESNNYLKFVGNNDLQIKADDFISLSATKNVHLNLNGSTIFAATDSGVGIGTSTPNALLHLNGGDLLLDRDGSTDVTRTLTIQGAGPMGGNIFGRIVFKGYDASSGSFEYEGAAITARNLGSSNHGALSFWTRDTELKEWMRITRSGEVQIGPDTNTASLNVNGSITAVGSVDVGNTEAFYMGDPNTNGSWRIIRSGNNLNFERREGGVWVAKTAILP